MQKTTKQQQIALALVPIFIGALIISGIQSFLNHRTPHTETPDALVIADERDTLTKQELAEEASETDTSSFKQRIRDFFSRLHSSTSQHTSDTTLVSEEYFSLPESPSFSIIDSTLPLDLDAKSFVVGDLETGEIIIEKNARAVFPIASVTKLMTASVGMDTYDADTSLTVSAQALTTEGTRGDLYKNQTISFGQILYPLLLVSSNDAGEVIAEGNNNRDLFIQKMNDKARLLAMHDTAYTDASGLSSKNISSAKDIFGLLTHLYGTQPEILKISATKKYTSPQKQTWSNHNAFVDKDNYIGGKTGYTFDAQKTGVFAFTVPIQGKGERPIAVALLRSYNRTGDIAKILNYLSTNIRYPEERTADTATVTLGFVGDIMLDRGVRTNVETKLGGSYDTLFTHVKDTFTSFDILFGNLEGPIADPDRGTRKGSKYSFRMDPRSASALARAGFDIVSFANNHVGDYGDEAFIDTLTHLDSARISYTGAGTTQSEASTVRIITKNNIRIGYLGFTDVGPTWMQATETRPGTQNVNKEYDATIKRAKEQVDVLIVSMHAGEEYQTKPNKRQKDLAYRAIDAGATAFIGHHPHVIGPVEEYKGGVIAYSLGNAVFDQSREGTREGLLLSLTVAKNGIVKQKSTVFDIQKDATLLLRDAKETASTRGVDVAEGTPLTIGWAGDIAPGYKRNGFIADPMTLFEKVTPILKKPSLMIANLEGVITNNPKPDSRCTIFARNCYTFYNTDTFAQALFASGIDAVNLANNHSYDYQESGFADTIALTKSAGLIPVGMAHTITYTTHHDKKIALIGFSYTAKHNHVDDHELVRSLIADAKKQAQIVIVTFHAGKEGIDAKHTPLENEYFFGEDRGAVRQFARVASSAGATLVLGSGPHTIRGIEWYNDTLIAYSVGNFAGYKAFSGNDYNKDAFVLETTFNKDGIIESALVVPIRIDDLGIPLPHTAPAQLFANIETLSKQDFGPTGVTIDDYGRIHKQPTATSPTNDSACGASNKAGPYLALFDAGRTTQVPLTTPATLTQIAGARTSEGKVICLTKDAHDDFVAMVAQAKKDNVTIRPTSGYRSLATQEHLFTTTRQRESGRLFYSVAEPGHSEHHLGTTIDVTSPEIKNASASSAFDTTKTYQWMQEHAGVYGFVQSYRKGEEDKTGYIAESWHWRYIGKDAVLKYATFDGTLEEFLSH